MRLVAVPLLFLSCTVFPAALARAEAPDAKTDLGANAAMKYWEAFALLPTLDRDQERLLEDCLKAPLDEKALKLIDDSAASRTYLHRGARLARCDWSLDYEDGIRLLLPHCSKSLALTRLTSLHARREFEQGHWQSGWDDVFALLKLARHVEATPIMIANLVGYRIESIAIETAAPWLPELKAVLTADGLAALEALPAPASLLELVVMEKKIGPQWLIGELKQAERRKTGGWQAVWNEILSIPGEGSEPSPQNPAPAAKSLEQALKILDDQMALNDQLAKIVALPWQEFDARYPQFVAQAASRSALAAFMLPSVDKYVASQRRCQAQFALFKAAVAVVQGGADKLKGFADPFGDGPFEYRPLTHGFELKSKFVAKDHPVSLTFGRTGVR